jgi:hypothetical protein
MQVNLIRGPGENMSKSLKRKEKIMIIENHIESETLLDYFFIEGTIDLDDKYFIEKIKEGVKQEDNNNFKTYVRDQMTSYHFFNKDKKFLNLCRQFIKYIDDRYNLGDFHLRDSWGYRIGPGNKTDLHTHLHAIWSGALYLHDHSQLLEFPDINKKIRPSKGKFVLFSSFLKHKAEKNESNEIKWGISFNFFFGHGDKVIVKKKEDA